MIVRGIRPETGRSTLTIMEVSVALAVVRSTAIKIAITVHRFLVNRHSAHRISDHERDQSGSRNSDGGDREFR
jgi:hypothetical protein